MITKLLRGGQLKSSLLKAMLKKRFVLSNGFIIMPSKVLKINGFSHWSKVINHFKGQEGAKLKGFSVSLQETSIMIAKLLGGCKVPK